MLSEMHILVNVLYIRKICETGTLNITSRIWLIASTMPFGFFFVLAFLLQDALQVECSIRCYIVFYGGQARKSVTIVTMQEMALQKKQL